MKYNELTLIELKKIAKEKNLKGYSKLNKQDLINLLNNHKKSKKQSGGSCDMFSLCFHDYEEPINLRNPCHKKIYVTKTCKKCRCVKSISTTAYEPTNLEKESC